MNKEIVYFVITLTIPETKLVFYRRTTVIDEQYMDNRAKMIRNASKMVRLVYHFYFGICNSWINISIYLYSTEENLF